MNNTHYAEKSLTELVNSFPEAATVFNRRGIDYCCGGDRTLQQAVGADEATELLRELEGAQAPPAEWQSLNLADMIDHIRATHHSYTRDQLKEIDTLSVRVLQAHFGAHSRELLVVHRRFALLKLELEEHLIKEEEILFPMLLAADAAQAGAERQQLEEQIRSTDDEHEAAGDLIRSLTAETRGFNPPGDACASFRELYVRLKALSEDIFLHVRKENTLLAPFTKG